VEDFFKNNNNKFREENVFKTMKKERNEENNIRLLYTTKKINRKIKQKLRALTL